MTPGHVARIESGIMPIEDVRERARICREEFAACRPLRAFPLLSLP